MFLEGKGTQGGFPWRGPVLHSRSPGASTKQVSTKSGAVSTAEANRSTTGFTILREILYCEFAVGPRDCGRRWMRGDDEGNSVAANSEIARLSGRTVKLDSARELKTAISNRLVSEFTHARPDVEAFGIGATSKQRLEPFPRAAAVGVAPTTKNEYLIAIRLQNRRLEEHPAIQEVVDETSGEVDIRYIGSVRKRQVQWHRARQRPLVIGCSIGHYKVTAGTLGAFVQKSDDAKPLILSNNHVLANENDATRGDAVLQPADYDDGNQEDRVASLDSFVALSPQDVNEVDCAVATIESGVDFHASTLTEVGSLSPLVEEIRPDMVVEKLGRTTGHTRGRVTAFELDNVVVEFDIGNVRFDGQIEIEGLGPSFSSGGDSGSLIYTSTSHNAFGLLFAGSETGGTNGLGVTYANPLGTVLASLGVSLIT
jgi:hypothetical protein